MTALSRPAGSAGESRGGNRGLRPAGQIARRRAPIRRALIRRALIRRAGGR